jgi:excisionase family DNA binding protein
MTRDDSTRELLTTGQVAQVLGVSRQHVVDLCERGVLPYVRVGSHRRVRRWDVEALTQQELTRDQSKALWLHHVVAARLALDPEGVLAKARDNLERLRTIHTRGMSRHWLDQWAVVLDEGADSVLQTLTSRSPHAVELRQNSPFAGVLSEEERSSALTAFRAEWRRSHAA